jgi:quercetin dioxygenase-like cupin family protein
MKKGQVIKWRNLTPEIYNTEAIKGVQNRVVIGEEHGAENFIMRVFTVQPGGHSPRHVHDWEHEVFILRGEGKVFLEDAFTPVQNGHTVFVPGGVEHQFVNTSETEEFEFICVIPKGGK